MKSGMPALVFTIACAMILAVIPLAVYANNPSGSIVIYGPNGTVVTGSRNV